MLPTRAKHGQHQNEDRRVAVEYILRRMSMTHPPSCLCFNATLLGFVCCCYHQTIRQKNWFSRWECGVQHALSLWSVHPLCDIIDGIVLPPRPPYWQAVLEVSDLTRANKSKQNILLIFTNTNHIFSESQWDIVSRCYSRSIMIYFTLGRKTHLE